MTVELSRYNNKGYNPGRGRLTRTVWYICNMLIFDSYLLPISSIKVFILRFFGAKIGRNAVIKPNVNIKYPWFLEIGDNVWMGEGVWIDNLCKVEMGNNVCISQGAYISTGSHNYGKETFDLVIGSVKIEDGVWVGARSIICLGVILKTHSVINAGSVVTKDTEPFTVYQGNPAQPIRERSIGG